MSKAPTSIKAINKLRVLNLLRLYPGISRAEICAKSGLGKATVSTIVSEWIAAGVISEAGARVRLSSIGRRPVNLELNGTARVAIGIELTGSECIAALTDLCNEPLRVLRTPMASSSIAATVEVIEKAAAELMKGHGRQRLLGIGVGVPGPVDVDRQRVIRAENIDWFDVPLGSLLTERIGKPVIVVKRNSAGALGEHWYGVGKGTDNLVYISIGVGIGSGIIVHGELYEGATGTAGEIGHLRVVPEGLRCRCGNLGCLETVASWPSVISRCRQKLQEGEPSLLTTWTRRELDRLTDRQILDVARQGDVLALTAIQEAARYLGIAIAGTINLFNPSQVIMEGSMLELGEVFFEPLREEVRRHAFSLPLGAVKIVPGQLGDRASAIGAATLVVDRFFTLANPLPDSQQRRRLSRHQFRKLE